MLSVLTERAQQQLTATGPGEYFALWVVTSLQERALMTFQLGESEHRPLVQLNEGTQQETVVGTGNSRPSVEIEDGAVQGLVTGAGQSSPEVHLEDTAGQQGGLGGGSHTPRLEFTEQTQQVAQLLSGDSRPLVLIQESAQQMMETGENGSYFLPIVTQELLEGVAQELVSGAGEFAASLATVEITEAGLMTVESGSGQLLALFPWDSFETYTSGEDLDGLNEGRNWTENYTARNNYIGLQAWDPFEDYTDSVNVDSLNLGTWMETGPFVARTNHLGTVLTDDFESYTDTVDLHALNGGGAYNEPNPNTSWSAFEAHEPYIRVYAFDDFDSYTVQDPIADTLNGGYGWNTAWTVTSPSVNNMSTSPEGTGGATDTFDDYASEAPVTSSLNSGVGWSGAWVLI